MKLTLESSRHEQDLDIVRQGMRRYTESKVPWSGYDELTICARDQDNQIIGAALGETGRGWLHIDVVWVHEDHRGRAIGTQLVHAAETEARQRGCHSAYLDTFSYQAPDFYLKLGYQIFGTLHDYPPGHQRHYMHKRLA